MLADIKQRHDAQDAVQGRAPGRLNLHGVDGQTLNDTGPPGSDWLEAQW
jgi:hypothetical protein